jgi:hypothetical protein
MSFKLFPEHLGLRRKVPQLVMPESQGALVADALISQKK